MHLQGQQAHEGRTNRLIGEKSPYLLQHARNPVDWYPWGDAAFRRAAAEHKPVFLSIGYAACHWCHVMERESFENPAIAALLNRDFVSVKVDREERPDVDAAYMLAVQMMTGQGGWPLSVFLTPDRRPFFGGTYFPPDDRHGRPGFPAVLRHVADAWRNRHDDVAGAAAELTDALRRAESAPAAAGLSPGDLPDADAAMQEDFDPVHGGFGGAPKFPPCGALLYLLRAHAATGATEPLRKVVLTLDRMAAGGFYDQLGGGFHRYTVDDAWQVPHFEKMLYDNALLARVYTEAWQATGHPLYRRIAAETLDYLLRDMTGPDGGFHCSRDADSEGEEGRYYLWSAAEVDTALADAATLFKDRYGVTARGNFEGRSILRADRSVDAVAATHRLAPEEAARRLDRARQDLLALRARRVPPARDDKVLAAWNGLAISALAIAAQAFDAPRYRDAAARAARFVLSDQSPGGDLRRVWRNGPGDVPAFLDDYAGMGNACLDLYAATFDAGWLEQADRLARRMLERFGADDRPGLYLTPRGAEDLPARGKPMTDDAVPAGNAMAALLLLRLNRFADDPALLRPAEAILALAAPLARRQPRAVPFLLCAADFHLRRPVAVVVAGAPGDRAAAALAAAARAVYRPALTLAVVAPDQPLPRWPLLDRRRLVDDRPAAYVCAGGTCRKPVTQPEALARLLAHEHGEERTSDAR